MQTEDNRFSPFFKGISLSDYMKDMNCPQDSQMEEEEQEETADLLLECQPPPSIAHYAIKEIDEDNYDQSADPQELIVQPLHNFDLQRARVIQADDPKNRFRSNPLKLIQARKNKNAVKSPLKQVVSPNREMFRSLYGHSFNSEGRHDGGQLLSTLGMSSWRGKHKSLNRKELELRDKNKRQYQQIVKYENVINQRMDSKLNSIRVDGIKDKIHDRNEKFSKGMK